MIIYGPTRAGVTTSFDTGPTAGTAVLRDANGRSQVADPSAAQDIATKNYVDSSSSPATKIIANTLFR